MLSLLHILNRHNVSNLPATSLFPSLRNLNQEVTWHASLIISRLALRSYCIYTWCSHTRVLFKQTKEQCVQALKIRSFEPSIKYRTAGAYGLGYWGKSVTSDFTDDFKVPLKSKLVFQSGFLYISVKGTDTKVYLGVNCFGDIISFILELVTFGKPIKSFWWFIFVEIFMIAKLNAL